MHRHHLAILTAVVLSVASVAQTFAASQSLNLTLPNSGTSNQIDITIGVPLVNDSDTQTTLASGNALATIGYDLYLGSPLISTLEFTGGRINLTSTSGGDIEFNLGNFILGIDIVGSGLGGTLDTPTPPGSVVGSSFDTSEHLLLIDRGTLEVKGRGLAGSVDETFDLMAEPADFQSSGTGMLEIVETVIDNRTRDYRVTLSLPVDATYTIEDPTTVNIDAAGTLLATDTFSVVLPLAGDYNGDGTVSTADYTVWRDTLGATGANLAADGNFDWVVDEADYGVWQDNFGSQDVSTTLLADSTVPEPTGLALVATGVIAFCLARRVAFY